MAWSWVLALGGMAVVVSEQMNIERRLTRFKKSSLLGEKIMEIRKCLDVGGEDTLIWTVARNYERQK